MIDRIWGSIGARIGAVFQNGSAGGGAYTNLGLQLCERVSAPARGLSRLWHTFPVLPGLLVCIGYYLGAKLGFALTLQPRPVSILWPPNSILLAALLLTPPRAWAFLFLAAFPAHWATQIQSSVPWVMIVSWFISNTFEALLGACAIRHFIRGPFRFDSFRAMGIFITFGVLLAPFISSFLDAALVALNRWGASAYWEVWRTRFPSNLTAAMTLVPLIVSWSTTKLDSIRKATPARLAEAALLCIGLFLAGLFTFVLPDAGPGRRPILIYAPLPFLLWAAVRFGFTGVSTAIFTMVLLAIWGTAHGGGPFSSRSPLENVLSVQLFLIVVSIPLFCLSAVLGERRRIEQRLQRSEARYREVVETQTDLICRFLPDTTLTFVNEAYCRFFNRNRDELIGTRFIELIPEAARGRTLDLIASISSNARVERVEHEVMLPDGTLAWQQWVNHAIRGSDGRVSEFQGIGRDITDRKRAEEANAKLTHMSRVAMVGELTASIVHEISQPLGAILSNAEAAEMLLEADPQNTDEMRQILSDIRKDDVRANEVIRHIRNLLHKNKTGMIPVDLNEILLGIYGFIRIEAQRRHITCGIDVAASVPMVEADPIQLQQVILNLALNAMDAMVKIPKPHRWLNLYSDIDAAGHVRVLVSDVGPGIPSEHLPRLFQSFFTTKKDGMGLGLSISKTIIEAHRGRIWGENNAGRGATFGFALPPIQDGRRNLTTN